jgi:ketosteroid isomerase-like protein
MWGNVLWFETAEGPAVVISKRKVKIVMLSRTCILTFALLILLCSAPAVRGDEVDELKTAFEQAIAALNKRDLDTWLDGMDEGIIYFSPTLPVPAVGKEINRQFWQNLFNTSHTISFTSITPQFHVTGSTGVVWGYYVLVTQPDEISINAIVGAYSATFTKADGKWHAVVIHNSVLPTDN